MGIFRSGRKPRRFDYEPRYYKPEEDEELKRRERMKRRMRIKSKSRNSRRSPFSLVFLLLLLAFAIFVYASI